MEVFFSQYGKAVVTAIGFFWKAGWAFVLGYVISSMIQVFVPKSRLTKHMGRLTLKTQSLATLFGAVSSSCSFAALAAARSLLVKGAHFAAVVAFMFASTNLVIELGILIYIFLGWQFVVAEIIGGGLLIIISTALIRMTYPKAWIKEAKDNAEQQGSQKEEFDPWQRLKSRQAWIMVCKKFVAEWKMVWQDVLIGFTVAGFMATLIPDRFWKALFLSEYAGQNSLNFWVALENALIAPFVAAITFIGSMGNIPLAAILNSGGVLFAGIMGFIYSDLMVPPLVHINAKYYGWRIALYIAGVMYISIVLTALILYYGFALLGLTPQSAKSVGEITQFKIDYTFFLNILLGLIAAGLSYVAWRHKDEGMQMQKKTVRQYVAYIFIGILIAGLAAHLFTNIIG